MGKLEDYINRLENIVRTTWMEKRGTTSLVGEGLYVHSFLITRGRG